MKKAGVIGLGLIGGSIALALRECGFYVVGAEKSEASAKFALSRGIVDSLGAIEDMRDCEVVFVCVPVGSTRAVMERAVEVTGGGAIVTDVASVKCVLRGLKGRIVGGHPLAGTEKSGIEAARSHLFENAFYVLIKGEQASDGDLDYMKRLVGEMKARPLVMTAEEHDRRVSAISHLPHVAAYALCEHALGSDDFAGTGFMDTTRIAASDADFWADVCLLNRDNLLADLDGYAEVLGRARGYLEAGDRAGLRALFASARDKRERLGRRRVYLSEYSLDVDVKDEVGALRSVMDLLAENGISVSGVQIINSREGVGGALRIYLRSESDYLSASRLLENRTTGGHQ